MRVWLLDWIGYDVRGGNATVYASLEAAKKDFGPDEWTLDSDGSWEGKTHGTTGIPVITEVEVRT